MKPMRVLVIDDDLSVDFEETFLTAWDQILTELGYAKPEMRYAINQAEAEHALALEPDGYDLILLDLNYPLLQEPLPSFKIGSFEGEVEFQGMKWLPELRGLQPQAAIVILTSHNQIKLAIRAVCELHANDFVSKNTPISQIVARVGVALKNAEYRQQLYDAEQLNLVLEDEVNELLRSRATRTYAEDAGKLMSRATSVLGKVAERLEGGDHSEMARAAWEIRGQAESLPKEFNDLTRRTIQDDDKYESVDVVYQVRQMLKLYQRRFANSDVKTDLCAKTPAVWVETYPGDLKVVLHEVISNALDSLKESHPEGGRLLSIVIEEVIDVADGESGKTGSRKVCIEIADNGNGFEPDQLPYGAFSPDYSTRQEKPNRGLGLYIAQRMMHHSGGDIIIGNRPEGGAVVSLVFDNLEVPGQA